MIALHDYVLSSDCYKVRLLLAFLGLEYRKVKVDLHPGRADDTPDFRMKSPFGTMPVLEDGDVTLHDAEPILAYLAMKYDPARTWFPADAGDAGRVLMWLQFAGRELAPLARLRDAAVRGALARDASLTAASEAAVAVLDDHLAEVEFGDGHWMVGAAPTVADAAVFAPVSLAEDAGIGLHRYPAVWRWIQRFRALPRFTVIPGVFPDPRGAYASA